MRWSLTTFTAPVSEPVSLQETKDHMRVDLADDDSVISAYITAAREHSEQFQGRAYITRTFDLFLDDWPQWNQIMIPRPPLQGVTSIVYTDRDGNAATFSAANYVVDTASAPGRIVLKSGASWPSVNLKEAAAIRIRYVAGYGDNMGSVPEHIRLAVMHTVAHWYEHREPVIVGNVANALPEAGRMLLWPNRVWYRGPV